MYLKYKAFLFKHLCENYLSELRFKLVLKIFKIQNLRRYLDFLLFPFIFCSRGRKGVVAPFYPLFGNATKKQNTAYYLLNEPIF